MEYNFNEIEKKWQHYWANKKTFATKEPSSKPKYYVLDMFPYPSGAGLHVGHPLGYIASDIVARYKRHKGFNVLHPMGYDSFGLPAEQYAIQTGQHPAKTTEQNIKRYREQLDKIGFSFDWDRELRTSNTEYYKWTQWIFIQIFNSWFNQTTNKAEHINSLIQHFEKNGTQYLNAASTLNTQQFTANGWQNFSEKEKSDILMKYRLAYLGEAYVNWCPALGTVLANDEIKDGLSERGGHPVERKLMKQWSMRITSYAQQLLDDLEKLDWTESLKESQRFWIGRSEGTSIKFNIAHNNALQIEVFTTRPDTIFGISFITLAPEHDLIEKITNPENLKQVNDYIIKTKNKSELERQAEIEKISGVFTGAYAVHPFSGNKIPIWVGDYVLSGYGTGAVMAVPGHDERDHRFAKHFNLPIIQVVNGHNVQEKANDAKEGKIINSDFLNDLQVKDAIKKAIFEIEKRKLGEKKINFRLRDAVFGRQRYWGEPIPIYYKNDIPYALSEQELPLVLPEVDKYLPTEDGEPPLARALNWKYKHANGETYNFEHSTMPGWAGSSWYFLRYMDVNNCDCFVNKESANYWQEVDLYIGGSEHATGHLLYVRFWTKILHDLNFIQFNEPAKKLINQGMIQGTSCMIHRVNGTNKIVSHTFANKYQTTLVHIDVNIVDNNIVNLEKLKEWRDDFKNAEYELDNGKLICTTAVEKMSKRWYNVVNPDDICAKYGADTFRLYEMFLGPLEQSKPWNTNGITGVSNFLKKLWRLYANPISDEAANKSELKSLHKAIKKITEDIERFSFNTSVSNFMICVNELSDLKCNKRSILEPLLILISPYAPHITEELWQKLGHNDSIAYTTFPTFNEEYLIDDNFNYPISFNGKTRFQFELPAALGISEIEKEVMQRDEVIKYLNGAQPKKIIIVPKKIVNIVH